MAVYQPLTLPAPTRGMTASRPARIIALATLLFAAALSGGCGGARGARAVSDTTTGAVEPANREPTGVVGLAEEQDRDF